ncbi:MULTISPECIES: hypothetical protein [unclassified Pseudoalteromonas]|uniref:hypothetical protein n=1 Tax=unclassified Pseudoalteromonas TaxID=194690 RepID=UPI001D6F71DB|nr:hypothetical protein [Pseudoalteromonas sp.]NRA78393.1 hypothetical protein [Pseudoalteromonas sp.]
MLKLREGISYQFLSTPFCNNDENYYRDKLLPLMKECKWKEVGALPALFSANGNSVSFDEDKWAGDVISKHEIESLTFTVDDRKLERNITNEIKSFSLARIYTGKSLISFGSIRGDVNVLKKLATVMLERGLDSFSMLNNRVLKELANDNYELFSDGRILSVLNIIIKHYDHLPFSVNFTKQTARKLGIVYRPKKQHLVIPPRIFHNLINDYTVQINLTLRHLPQLESEIERMLDIQQRFKDYLFRCLREGASSAPFPFKNMQVYEYIQGHFTQNGIELVDNFSSEVTKPGKWEELMEELKPSLKGFSAYSELSTWSFEPFKLGKLSFATIGSFKDYLFELDYKCKAMCLILSGMRIDELNSMHPDFGAQSYTYNQQKIHVFTTRQSKIKTGIQTIEDIFVTTQTGHNAFKLLSTIHRPYLKRIKEPSGFFASLKASNFLTTNTKAGWNASLRENVNKWLNANCLNRLTVDDVSFLQTSNPDQEHSVGLNYKFTPHQTRRSFAFYMIGLELMAFPQLKKQLSHLSTAMTRHYANNATYWGKLRNELDEERVLQRSKLLSNVYERIAQNGRIAGGKGKALKKIAGSHNYFELGDNKRKLDVGYWRELLKSGKSHIHAIAPGMYCTNNQCDMRINVSLDECVDCEFDVIMDGLYAEGKRLNAHRNLSILDEQGELNSSVASQLVVQIRSCERILSDLEIPFEQIILPQSVENFLIPDVVSI